MWTLLWNSHTFMIRDYVWLTLKLLFLICIHRIIDWYYRINHWRIHIYNITPIIVTYEITKSLGVYLMLFKSMSVMRASCSIKCLKNRYCVNLRTQKQLKKVEYELHLALKRKIYESITTATRLSLIMLSQIYMMSTKCLRCFDKDLLECEFFIAHWIQFY